MKHPDRNASRRMLCLAPLALLAPPGARAQDSFPSRQPIRLVVPYPAGGGLDTVSRPLAEKLGQSLGQAVIVDNRGGANGAIGMEFVAKAPPDGYTIILTLDSQLAINPNLYKSVPYDPVKDYVPITLLGAAPYILVTNPRTGIKSVGDLIAAAKKAEGKLNYASSGVGSGAHMAAVLLESTAKISMTHVPNNSTPSSLRDVAENDCQVSFVTFGAAKPLMDAGRLIPIATGGAKRTSLLPNVPTVAETLPGYESRVVYGILAPARTPQAIIDRLYREIEQIARSADYQQKIASAAVEVVALPPAEFGEEIKQDLAKWKRMVAERGIAVN